MRSIEEQKKERAKLLELVKDRYPIDVLYGLVGHEKKRQITYTAPS
jgi:hypothetical protein